MSLAADNLPHRARLTVKRMKRHLADGAGVPLLKALTFAGRPAVLLSGNALRRQVSSAGFSHHPGSFPCKEQIRAQAGTIFRKHSSLSNRPCQSCMAVFRSGDAGSMFRLNRESRTTHGQHGFLLTLVFLAQAKLAAHPPDPEPMAERSTFNRRRLREQTPAIQAQCTIRMSGFRFAEQGHGLVSAA